MTKLSSLRPDKRSEGDREAEEAEVAQRVARPQTPAAESEADEEELSEEDIVDQWDYHRDDEMSLQGDGPDA